MIKIGTIHDFRKKIPWLNCENKKFEKIHKDFIYVLYKEFRQIDTKMFKEKMIQKFKNKYIINFLYSFQDNTGSFFDHQIRNTRNTFEKANFLIKGKNGGYSATKKLLNKDISLNIANIQSFIEKYSNQAKKIGIQNIIKKFEFDFDAIKVKTKKEIEDTNMVKYLRSCFRSDLENEYETIMEKIDGYYSTCLIDNDFKFPEGAHIISVKKLFNEKRYADIANHQNGLLLDPNTHTLFDRGTLLLQYDNGYKFVDNQSGKIIEEIRKDFINDERKKYLDEYIKKQNNIQN